MPSGTVPNRFGKRYGNDQPMSKIQRNIPLSPEEYLGGERYSEIRHEYEAGRVYSMVGASKAHNLIAGNLYVALHTHLRRKSCQVFMSDMKVRAGNCFYYPDVVVTCSQKERHDYYLEYPVLVIEVTSPSTEQRDSLDKRIAYQSLGSLKECVLVAQEKKEVRVYRRGAEGWDREIYSEGEAVRLDSVDLELPREAIYARV
jgi:Uma2 family endonuclease